MDALDLFILWGDRDRLRRKVYWMLDDWLVVFWCFHNCLGTLSHDTNTTALWCKPLFLGATAFHVLNKGMFRYWSYRFRG